MTTAVGEKLFEIPNLITYQARLEEKVSWCWSFFQAIQQKMGELLRNAFYLPLYGKKVIPIVEETQRIAAEEIGVLKEKGVFSMKDIVFWRQGEKSQEFHVRVLESKQIGGRVLRIILFSFNGQDQPQRWEPLTIRELSETPLCMLRALKEVGIRVDSLGVFSLGSAALDGLKYFSSQKEDRDIIPPTIIKNRSLASIQKTGNQLFPFPINYLLFGAARLCGWDANPEQELLNFLQASSGDQCPRKVVMIETPYDFYSSGKGAFDPDIHTRIAKTGASVFRASFHPFLLHERAHHAVSIKKFKKNCETKIEANTDGFSLGPREKVTSMIAREIFLSGDEPCHTCFLVCGSGDTLDTGTILEALPLMSAFIEEAEKLEAVPEKMTA